jgi:CTP synthase (UTP-ammonia lyase)
VYRDVPVDESLPDRPLRVAVVGDRAARFAAQDTIETALGHSAAPLDATVEVRWFATPTLEHDADTMLERADAVWCAPGSPFASMEGALEGIRFARERGRPFLGTCAGFQHGVIEFARHVLGVADAHLAEYDDAPGTSPWFIDELLCSLVGQAMTVRLVDSTTRAVYGGDETFEEYYCRFGLNETHTAALADAGLVVSGVDGADRTTRIMRITDHPFFYLTLFVPQTASTADEPHPLITKYVEAALDNQKRRRTR